jgi:hypothetical protein
MVLAGRYSVVATSTRTAPLNLSHRVRSGKLRVKLLLHVGGMSLANVSRSFTCVVVPPQFPTICRQPWRSIKALTKDLHRDIRLTQPLAPLNTFPQPCYKFSHSLHRSARCRRTIASRRRRLRQSEPKTKVKLPPQKSLTTTSACSQPLTMIRSLQFAVCVVPSSYYIYKAPVDTSMWFMHQTKESRANAQELRVRR